MGRLLFLVCARRRRMLVSARSVRARAVGSPRRRRRRWGKVLVMRDCRTDGLRFWKDLGWRVWISGNGFDLFFCLSLHDRFICFLIHIIDFVWFQSRCQTTAPAREFVIRVIVTHKTEMDSGKLLPIITVQPSFRTVISEVDTGIIPSDDFWVSCYKESSPSVHSKIHVKVNEVHRDVVDLEPGDSRVQIQAQISEVSWIPPDRSFVYHC